jgi:hypothetical protein
MSAQKYDFTIEQGVSFELSFIYKDSNNNPIDLTGWCARLTWRTNKRELSSFFTDNADLQNYKFIILNEQGKLILQFPSSTTNNFDFQSAKYDLELRAPVNIYENGGRKVERILYGIVNIVPRFSQNPEVLTC